MDQGAIAGSSNLLSLNRGTTVEETAQNIASHRPSDKEIQNVEEQNEIVEEASSRASSLNNSHTITVKHDLLDAEETARLKKMGDTHMIVAALVATVTFAARFTMPGGYYANEGPLLGLAILRNKPSFKVFVVADTLALVFSLIAIGYYFNAATQETSEALEFFITAGISFLKFSIHLMVVAFLAGTYASLAPSSLAIAACVVGSVLSFLIVGLIECASPHGEAHYDSVDAYSQATIDRIKVKFTNMIIRGN